MGSSPIDSTICGYNLIGKILGSTTRGHVGSSPITRAIEEYTSLKNNININMDLISLNYHQKRRLLWLLSLPFLKKRYTITNYKGEQISIIPTCIEDYGDIHRYDARYGLGNRNNDPNNPRIPKIGDKVRLDTECFLFKWRYLNGATGIIVEEKEGGFFTFQAGKHKIPIRPEDIQWYYD